MDDSPNAASSTYCPLGSPFMYISSAHDPTILFTQDDVVMGTLSVRENLHFSAALRLPSHMTHAQRKERVERVIDELGLRSCASTKV